MDVNSADVVSSPFSDVVTPNVDLYSFIAALCEQYSNKEAVVCKTNVA